MKFRSLRYRRDPKPVHKSGGDAPACAINQVLDFGRGPLLVVIDQQQRLVEPGGVHLEHAIALVAGLSPSPTEVTDDHCFGADCLGWMRPVRSFYPARRPGSHRPRLIPGSQAKARRSRRARDLEACSGSPEREVGVARRVRRRKEQPDNQRLEIGAPSSATQRSTHRRNSVTT
jgi:hypothetical protein